MANVAFSERLGLSPISSSTSSICVLTFTFANNYAGMNNIYDRHLLKLFGCRVSIGFCAKIGTQNDHLQQNLICTT